MIFVLSFLLCCFPSAGELPTFEEWRAYHGKEYSSDEYIERKKIFDGNIAYLKTENVFFDVLKSVFLDVPASSFENAAVVFDMDMGDGRSLLGEESRKSLRSKVKLVDYSTSDNSRQRRITSEVYDQTLSGSSKCGSCYAFASVSMLESSIRMFLGKSVTLSKQQLIDCPFGWPGLKGCRSGSSFSALSYIERHGICEEASFRPYNGHQGICSASGESEICGGSPPEVPRKAFFIKGIKSVSAQKLGALLYEYGPLALGIYAPPWFQFYSGGLIDTEKCGEGTGINHAVVLVGLVLYEGRLAWKVQNSYGPEWGEDGYFYVAYTEGEGNGPCWITAFVSYVVWKADVVKESRQQ